MYHNTTGTDNTAIGYEALNGNEAGTANIVIGPQALTKTKNFNNTGIGVQNTANGYGALGLNDEGNRNSAFGNGALSSNKHGYENTAVGKNQGQVLLQTTGTHSTFKINEGVEALIKDVDINTGNGLHGRAILNDGYLKLENVIITDTITGGSVIFNTGDIEISGQTQIIHQ